MPVSALTLYIANKNYSSWSLRPWLAMRVKSVAFTECLVPFTENAGNPAFAVFSPTAKVPVLAHRLEGGDLHIWESLAILEYLAELHPDRGFWPAGAPERAKARAMSAEMVGGFAALRSACPMNMRRERRAIALPAGVTTDVARIERSWDEALQASGGPFLFGEFCNADAMYAPVVNRLDVYMLTDRAETRAYMQSVQALPAWQEWQAAGRAEPWVVPEDEA
jgi:glutathione S-transferase